MASTEVRFPGVVTIVAATLTLLCICAAAPAIAQDGSLKDFLFRDKRGESQRQAPPPPAWLCFKNPQPSPGWRASAW